MSTDDSKSPRDFISKTVIDCPPSGIREFFDIVSTMPDIISLGVGEPDFTTPWHIREASIQALEHGITGYTGNSGLPQLRKAVSGYLESDYNVSYCPEEEILITVGVSEALDLAVRAIVNPGDEIIYHEPCYVSYRPLIQFSHGVPVAIETKEEDEFRMTAKDLEAAITPKTKAVIMNFPNNPTGGSLRPQDVEELAHVIKKHNLIVITDEIYTELTYDTMHVSIAALEDMKDRTIFLHGFSKALAMTGFRIGYACGPKELIHAMTKIHQYTMLCAPILSQEAAIEALKNPQEDIAEMKAAYHQRRNYFHSAMRDLDIPMFKPGGAFYAFPNISQFGLSSRDFAFRFLEEQKVALVPGTAFGACGEGFVRCSYATSLDDLKEAVKRLKEFTEGLKKSNAVAS